MMKKAHPLFSRLAHIWRAKAVRVMAATGVLMLLISALPMLALQLSDVGLLTAPHARGQATGALSPKGDDLYIVRALAQRRQQTLDEEKLYGESAAIAMGYEGQMLMAGYLDEMQTAGVLPEELTGPLSYEMEQDGFYECTYQADAAGFLTFSLVNVETNMQVCGLTVESHTGKVVSMRLLLIDGSLPEINYAELLQAYCEYLGLTILEDWALCTGTYYGENALYSQNGETLLAASEITDDAAGLHYLMMDARVVPAEQYQTLGATYDAMRAQKELPAAAEGLRSARWNSCLVDDTHCIWMENTEAGCLMTLLDKTNMTNRLLCAKPGCTHAPGSTCPAWVDYPLAVFAQNGQIYAVFGEAQDDAYTFVLRKLEQEADWVEIARILPQEYGVEDLTSYTSWYESEGALYCFFAANSEGLESGAALMKIRLDSGDVQMMPASAGMRVLGVWNGLFVCGRTVMPAALGALLSVESGGTADYLSAQAEVFLKSPVTGEECKITQIPGASTSGWSAGIWAVDGDELYCLSGQNGMWFADMNSVLWRTNLATGALEPLFEINSEEILALNMLYDGKAMWYDFAASSETAGQAWIQLSTQEITPVTLQFAMPYGTQTNWEILCAWGDDFLVHNRSGEQNGIVWDGYALIPRQAFWASDAQQAVPFDETPVLHMRQQLQNENAFAEDRGG